MSAPAFTPWTANDRFFPVDGTTFTPIDDDQRTVALVRVDCPEAAHLIAAAPELYEALDDVLIHCLADIEEEEGRHEPNPRRLKLFRARRDKAQAALAKARGEA